MPSRAYSVLRGRRRKRQPTHGWRSGSSWWCSRSSRRCSAPAGGQPAAGGEAAKPSLTDPIPSYEVLGMSATHEIPCLTPSVLRSNADAPFDEHFLQFCIVGASGVFVNLLALFVFRECKVHASNASALAIQVSILSNFFVHEVWTFKDRRDRHVCESTHSVPRCLSCRCLDSVDRLSGVYARVLRSQFWAVAFDGYLASHGTEWGILRLISGPPAIGRGIYLAQLAGIAVATGWNFR